MRYTFLIGIIVFLAGCKKDKFTSVPQITYKSINPNTLQSNIPFNAQVIPVLTLHLTDADGDLGFVDNKDTSYVFIKNLLTNKIDSLRLPDLKSSAKKYFEADVEIALGSLIESSLLPSPKIDTTFFEVYIQDFAKNKSNVIITPDPVYFITP